MIFIFLAALALWWALFAFLHFAQSNEEIPISAKSNDVLTILICARNEADNIADCLRSIHNQNWLPDQVHVIIVDDHSDDNTGMIVQDLKSEFSRFDVDIENLTSGSGKKDALKQGLRHVDGGLIYTTDADCTLAPNVIENLFAGFYQKDVQVVIGAVVINTSGLFSKWVAAENLNNQCVTLAFANLGYPILANGANMMFTSDLKQDYLQSLDSNTASGDDVFFIQSRKRNTVVGVFNETTSVATNPPSSLSDFVNQRVRWASKSTKYNRILPLLFGGFIVLLNTVFVAMWLLLPFVSGAFWIGLILLCKFLVEYTFHSNWFENYGVKHTLIDSLLLSITYPFYTLVISLISILGIGYTWKGRQLKR